ncbi:unnamed protein product, partial [Rotaria magnacalcarata]
IIITILAVQKERDRLGRQRNHVCSYGTANTKSNVNLTGDLNEDEDDLSVTALLKAEKTAQDV